MSKLKDLYTLRPIDFKPGDVIACVVTLHLTRTKPDGTPLFRMYRCAYPNPQTSEGIPQGAAMEWNEEMAQALFPVAISARELAKE